MPAVKGSWSVTVTWDPIPETPDQTPDQTVEVFSDREAAMLHGRNKACCAGYRFVCVRDPNGDVKATCSRIDSHWCELP